MTMGRGAPRTGPTLDMYTRKSRLPPMRFDARGERMCDYCPAGSWEPKVKLWNEAGLMGRRAVTAACMQCRDVLWRKSGSPLSEIIATAECGDAV